MKSVKVKYHLELEDPVLHYFKIMIGFKRGADRNKYIDLKLPVWRPGRYLILEFASAVQDFCAIDSENESLKWKKINKCTWRIYCKPHTKLEITYKVYANEFDLRTKGFDEKHAFVNPTSVFMFTDCFRYKPLTLEVKPYKNWHVSTGLDRISENIYFARDYDYFTDSPLEIGSHKDYEFSVEDKKHIISFYGEANHNIERMINDFTEIIESNYRFWGSVPYDKYVFIVHCTPQSGGGTEHINSTVVGVKPAAFETAKGYVSFLRLISHEFFHTWNVKQVKPAGLTPYDFTNENYTSELWVAEGGTSYYDGLMLRRTGQISVEDYFEEILSGIVDERSRPGYRVQSVAESSFDAWIKFWRFAPNAFRMQSNYYTMGSYVCLILDLEIRNASGNKHSLDNVFRRMYKKFPLDKKGYTNKDFRKACEKFSGISLKHFFDEYVFGTNYIEWEKYLMYAGIKLEKGEVNERITPGLFFENPNGNIIVSSVMPHSPADRAGIIKGDEVIAVDDIKAVLEILEYKIKDLKEGDSLSISVFRADKLHKFVLRVPEHNPKQYELSKVNNPTILQKSIFEGWLRTNW